MFVVNSKTYGAAIILVVIYINYGDSCSSDPPAPPPDCSGVYHPHHGHVSCSNGNRHESRCTYSCSSGFGICSGRNHCFTCNSGHWGPGDINPPCCDIQAPTITCPSSITKKADALLTSTVVEWSPAVAQDNYGTPSVSLTSTKLSGSTFTEGTHTISYEACDPAGYKNDCSFTVTVTVNRCDRPIDVEHQTMICNDPEFKYGTTCLFSCNAGWCLDGGNELLCDNQGSWNTDQPACTPIQCPSLTPPANGYIVSCSSALPPGVTTAGTTAVPPTTITALPPDVTTAETTAVPPATTVLSPGVTTAGTTAVPPATTALPPGVTSAGTLTLPPATTTPPPGVTTAGTTTVPPTTTTLPPGVTTAGTTTVPPATTTALPPDVTTARTTTVSPATMTLPLGVTTVGTTTVPPATTPLPPGVTTAETTAVPPATTTLPPGVTTAGTTTVPQATTTLPPGVTTAGTTTVPPETTTPPPGVTTAGTMTVPPSTTTLPPGVTTAGTTTVPPATTTVQPEVTTIAPTTAPVILPVGSECDIACDDGYRLSDNNARRFCQIQVGYGCSAAWSGHDIVCNRVMCPLLVVSSPASITGCTAGTEAVPSGTSCQLQCPDGYRSVGDEHEAVCNGDGTWSNEDFQCEVISCDSLQEVFPAYHSSCNKAPEKDEVGASCQWYCRTGYFYSGGSNVSTCQPDGTWDFTDFTCEAITCSTLTATSPAVLECSGSAGQYSFGTSCQWSCDSGYRGIGSDISTCLADGTWDKQDFVCEEITCASLVEPHPSYHTGCNKPPDGTDEVGDICQWHCRSGFYGTGTNTSTCLPDGTWDNANYNCQVVQCEPLDIPSNGAMVCDITANVKFCYINCRDDFDIPRSVSRDDDFQQPYVCRDGDWENSEYKVPDCEGTRRPSHLLGSVDLYYYSDAPCNGENIIQEIEANFEALILDSIYSTEYCEGGCGVKNVEVFCGSRRRRNAESNINWRMHGKTTIKDQKRLDALLRHTMRQKGSKTKQVKRNSPYEFTVSFDITMTFNPDPDSDLVDASWDAVDNLYYMMDELYVMAENDQLVPDVDGMDIDTRLQDGYPINYWDEEVSPECDPGYVEATGSLLCTACFLGTYNVNGGCEGCPIGTYQDEKAQIECKLCPEGMSTLRTGSQNITDCKTICHPGQYSTTGLAPCTDCSVGSYQPLTRSTECILCPDGQSTVQSGCQSQDNCEDVCLPGEISSTGIVPCTACSRGSYQPDQMATECLSCPIGQNTAQEGSQFQSDCKEQCLPGSWSSTGLTPCMECEVNSYQTESGQTECTSCPDNTGTIETGANSPSQCVVTHCSALPVDAFTNEVSVRCTDSNSVGSNCTFLCQEGYEMTGISEHGETLVCLGDGTWNMNITSFEPICEVKSCETAIPPLPPHARVDTRYPCSNQYGSSCKIVCEDRTVLRGSSQATCDYDSVTEQTYWSWDQEPYCLGKDQTCPSLPRPQNGFWACNQRGSVCNLRCLDGKDVRKSEETQYICSNGVWAPSLPSVIACKQTTPGKDIKQTNDAQFDSADNCTDVELLQRIREGVVTYLNSTFFGETCQDKCVVQDVEVSCEENTESDRRRRRRRKRQEPNVFKMEVYFTLKKKVNETATNDDIADDVEAISFITQKISREIQDGTFNAYVGGMSIASIPVNGSPLESSEIVQTCPGGYSKAASTLTCIACDVNTYETNGECHSCPSNQYQPQEGQTSCIVPQN
ncbi:uncharacterized protein [Amphiura filiformis]